MTRSLPFVIATGATLLCALAITPAAHAQSEPPETVSSPRTRPKHCVGYAIVGALGGGVIGHLSAFGAIKAAGEDTSSKPAYVSMLAVQGVSATAGTIATCRLLSDDPRVVPAATFVTAGVYLGGAALGGAMYLVMDQFRPFGEGGGRDWNDTAVAVGFVLGAIGGGYLGYRVSEGRESRWDPPSRSSSSSSSNRSPQSSWSFAPLVSNDRAGVMLGGSF